MKYIHNPFMIQTAMAQATSAELTLVKLHRGNPALWADGGFEIKNAGYPFVFERFSDDKRVLVAINPSDNSYVCELLNNSKVLINQNTEISDGKAILGGVSILVAEQQLS